MNQKLYKIIVTFFISIKLFIKTIEGPGPPDEKLYSPPMDLKTNIASPPPTSSSLVSYLNNNSNNNNNNENSNNCQLNCNESINSQNSQINSPCQESLNNSTGSESSWLFTGIGGGSSDSPNDLVHHDGGFEWFFHRNKVSSRIR